MFLTHAVHNLYDSLLCVLYPQSCLICGKSVESRIHAPACLDCWNVTRMFSGQESVCWRCGVVTFVGRGTVDPERIQCHRCDTHLFEVARACGVYEVALRESILQLKRQPRLSPYLMPLLIAAAQRPPLHKASRIIPVPLHAERERQRGFNQAAVIARAIGPSLGLIVDETSLTRVVASHKYRAGLDEKGRLDTVANAFEVRFPAIVRNEVILLVDDVFTTGATASSCAAALMGSGAKSVHVLTLARPPN
jgi:ComF family protein